MPSNHTEFYRHSRTAWIYHWKDNDNHFIKLLLPIKQKIIEIKDRPV